MPARIQIDPDCRMNRLEEEREKAKDKCWLINPGTFPPDGRGEPPNLAKAIS